MKRKHAVNANEGINRMTLRRMVRSCASALLIVLIGSSTLIAQTSLSFLRGTATDPTGAVLPGVQITVTDIATNITVRSVATDENGNYEVPDLKQGTYRINADKQGFRAFVADKVLMEAGRTRRVDIVMQVGATTEIITVEGGAALVTTEGGAIAGEVENRKFLHQPAVDAYPSPLAMLTTVPGIKGNGWNLIMSGQGRGQQTWAMDGIPNDTTGDQNDNPNFYETVQVTTVLPGAESTRATNFNMVSKRGANEFHGGAFYRHFNSALNARTFFEARKTPFIQHEGAVEAGGPIIKDRTFFYASWFHQVIPLGSFVRSSVPTLKMRSGDFSQFATAIRDPLTGQPFPNKIIPADRINPVSRRVTELYYPAPNLGGPDTLTNNFGYIFPYNSDLYKGDWPFFRIDHNLTKKNSLYFRWSARITPYIRPRATPQLGWTEDRDHRQWVVSDTHVFSPGLVNTFTLGWQTDLRHQGEKEKDFTPLTGDAVIKAIGLQGTNRPNYSTQGFPRMVISGLSTLETTNGGIDNVLNDQYTRTWKDDLTWSKAKHVLKFGGEFREYSDRNASIPQQVYGEFIFNGTFTGNGYADFLLGIPFDSTRVDPLTNRITKEKQVGLYISDSFKVTPKLTLDYGLRWDYYSSPTLRDGLMYNWNPATGDVIVAPGTLAKVHPLYPRNTIKVVEGEVVPVPDKKNFRPRIAAAYRLKEKMVIRGGYGEYTETFGYFSRRLLGGPFQLNETYRNSIVSGQPLFSFPNPFPASLASATVPSQSITALPLQSDNGVVRQFNLSIEQEWHDMGFRISYIGSRGDGLNYFLNINKPQPSTTPFTASRRPFTQFVNTTVARTDGQSHYDALQLSVQRRMGTFTFNAHYTYSNNMFNYGLTENPYNVTSRWLRDGADRRHYATINTTWDVPVGKGRQYLSNAPAIVDHLLGGWQFQTISYFGTGGYFSPAFSGADPSNTGTSGGLPDRIKDGNKPDDQKTKTQWFDPTAFVRPPTGRFGNSGGNILEGQGINVHHLSVAKSFALTERWRFSYTAAISNLFNQAHFNNPLNNISNPNPGQFTSTIPYYNPEKQGFRQMSMTLRVQF